MSYAMRQKTVSQTENAFMSGRDSQIQNKNMDT